MADETPKKKREKKDYPGSLEKWAEYTRLALDTPGPEGATYALLATGEGVSYNLAQIFFAIRSKKEGA